MEKKWLVTSTDSPSAGDRTDTSYSTLSDAKKYAFQWSKEEPESNISIYNNEDGTYYLDYFGGRCIRDGWTIKKPRTYTLVGRDGNKYNVKALTKKEAEEKLDRYLNESVNFKLRESDETNAMMDLMQHNNQFKDDPYVGSFWYDPNNNELFGIYSVLADNEKFYKSKLFDQEVRTGTKLHKDIWRKEQFKGKDSRFKGDHTLMPRGRVFQLEDGSFKVMVGDWFDTYPQCKGEIMYEFQLPEDTEFIKDAHWNIGRGFSDEFLGESLTESLKKLTQNQAEKIVDTIKVDGRHDPEQFRKLFDNKHLWFGEFDGNRCTALISIRKDSLNLNDYYINEFQSFEKGSGKKLLNQLIDKYNTIWLMSDPGATNSLKDYYRQFGLSEFVLDDNIYNRPVSFFYNKGLDDEKFKKAVSKYYGNETYNNESLQITEKIIRKSDGYYVTSEDGKKNLGGPYKKKEDAEKRLNQVEYFKNKDKKKVNESLDFDTIFNSAGFEQDVINHMYFTSPNLPSKTLKLTYDYIKNNFDMIVEEIDDLESDGLSKRDIISILADDVYEKDDKNFKYYAMPVGEFIYKAIKYIKKNYLNESLKESKVIDVSKLKPFKTIKAPNGTFWSFYKKDDKVYDSNGIEVSEDEIRSLGLTESLNEAVEVKPIDLFRDAYKSGDYKNDAKMMKIYQQANEYFKKHPVKLEDVPDLVTLNDKYKEDVNIDVYYDKSETRWPSEFESAYGAIEDYGFEFEIIPTNVDGVIMVMDRSSDDFTTMEEFKKYLTDERVFNYEIQEQAAEFERDGLFESLVETKIKTTGKMVEVPFDDEETEECEWCGEETPIEELHNTNYGHICDYCIQEIKSRGERIRIEESSEKSDTGVRLTKDNKGDVEEGDKLADSSNEYIVTMVWRGPRSTTITVRDTKDWKPIYNTPISSWYGTTLIKGPFTRKDGKLVKED